MDYKQLFLLGCECGESGADREGLEGGEATGEALACCAFHALMDLILSRSQALTDQVVDRLGNS